MNAKQLFVMLLACGLSNFAYQLIGPGHFMVAVERTYFMWLALGVAWWYCRVTR